MYQSDLPSGAHIGEWSAPSNFVISFAGVPSCLTHMSASPEPLYPFLFVLSERLIKAKLFPSRE